MKKRLIVKSSDCTYFCLMHIVELAYIRSRSWNCNCFKRRLDECLSWGVLNICFFSPSSSSEYTKMPFRFFREKNSGKLHSFCPASQKTLPTSISSQHSTHHPFHNSGSTTESDLSEYFFLKAGDGVVWTQDTIDSPSLNCFRIRLNKVRCIQMCFFFIDWSANRRPSASWR